MKSVSVEFLFRGSFVFLFTGLEEFVNRSSLHLTETRNDYELIAKLEQRRSQLRSMLQSKYEELDSDEFVKTCISQIRSLRNLNSTQVDIAQGCYDNYDFVINELDRRIALYQEALSIPAGVSEVKMGVKEEELEPRYCICGGVGYGKMICCDNPNCPIEWFHFSCLADGDFEPPEGQWLCPRCRAVTSSDGI